MNEEIVNLSIAEMIVTKDPVVICTVLGSCVSVCLFDENAKGGGIIHYALPLITDTTCDNPLRYGDYAIVKLIEQTCQHLTIRPEQLKAKVVGGANNIGSEHPTQHVGSENIKIAKSLLDKYHIQIVGEDVGGFHGRKVLFHVYTGRLQVAFVGPGFSRPSAMRAINIPKAR